MKNYFRDMDTHMLSFDTIRPVDHDLVDLAFNKKKADDRKEWLRQFVPGTYLDHRIRNIPISDFINKELILFSMADNIRSIPSVVDGLKPGQRKVLFGCFKRKLKTDDIAVISLEASIDGAHGVLLSVQGGSDLGLFEINEAARLVQEAAHPEANIIFGAVIDDALGDEVRVTVIAAGFDGGAPQKRNDERPAQQGGAQQRPAQQQTSAQMPSQQAQQSYQPQAAAPATIKPVTVPGTTAGPTRVSAPPARVQPGQGEQQHAQDAQQGQAQQGQSQQGGQQAPEVVRPPKEVTFEDRDDLDVPDFLK